MKNILKKATMLALVLGTLSVNAKVTEINNSEDATVVQFGFVRKGAQIFIKDAQDYLLYKYKVDQTGQFFKSFDFTTLPNGEYFFEVHEERTIQIMPFEVAEGHVNFEEKDNYTVFKPVLRSIDSKVTFNWLTVKNDPLEVRIYDTKDRLLYKEKVTNKNEVKRVFNMSNAKNTDFVFTVKAGNRRFVERIELKK